MPKFADALRGYAFPTLRRDGFVCTYCGLDGTGWPNYLYLSWDHLVPRGHARRDDPDYVVAACTFCNALHNRTVFDVEGKTPAELVAQKRPLVLARRADYARFWDERLRPQGQPRYWVYENRPTRRARAHLAGCSFCNDGRGRRALAAATRNRRWLGPFTRPRQALGLARGLQPDGGPCAVCFPR